MTDRDPAAVGRPLFADTDPELARFGYNDPGMVRRRAVLKETLTAFTMAEPADRYHQLARDNLDRWHRAATQPSAGPAEIRVLPGDWGDVTLALTEEFAACFAVLNMANAWIPGGGYVEGMVAQEENMFRRTDCHFSVGPEVYDADFDRYDPAMTALLSAAYGRVYLDTVSPRVCLRGSEDRARADLGYRWLAETEIFPFFELRAAAVDLSDGSTFDPAETRRRVAAQLETLRAVGARHAVLGAFGCGAFNNPAAAVAQIYRDEIEARRNDFTVIAFAIFAAGYGPSNYEPFREVFDGV